jgi:hypothetical protein
MNKQQIELVYFFLYMVFTFIIASFATWFVWMSQVDNPTQLYDIMFQIFPDWSFVEVPVPNIIFLLQVIIATVAIKQPKVKYVCQLIFINCTLIVIRSFSIASTHMPNIKVYEYCKERPDNYFRIIGLMITNGTCSDYMFSGHTVTSFLIYLFVRSYKTRYVYELINGVCLGATILSLIVLRWHYTSDIIVALVVTWLMYYLYKEKEDDRWFYFKSFDLARKKRFIESN